jgi:hypothetical protein
MFHHMLETGKTGSLYSRVSAFLIFLTLLLFAFYGATHGVASGDTWVALACGRHIVDHGLDTSDPFSENSFKPGPAAAETGEWPAWVRWCTEKAGPTWHPTGVVNNIWLSHVLFYWLACESPFARGDDSFDSLVWLKLALYLLTVICIYLTGRALGAAPPVSLLFTCLCVCVSRTFWDIRPAAFTNLFIAAFFLILAHGMRGKPLYLWLMVPLVALWCNLHSGFCFVFAALPLYVVVSLSAPLFKGRATIISRAALCRTMSAGALSLIASILFSPFHLSNITFSSFVAFGPAAREWYDVYEWRPAFQRGLQFGDTAPFLGLCIIALLLVIAFAVTALLSRAAGRVQEGTVARHPAITLDIGYFSVVILAFSMAIAHRRLVPVAAIAACPFLAALCSTTLNAVASLWGHSDESSPPRPVTGHRKPVIAVTALFIVALGGWWAFRFREAYIDPLPADERHTSLFMRMTVSSTKPFQACAFIKDNKLNGAMFNFWSDGGFIAWEELPDPRTGRIPLQLFVDQRAHRAFDYSVRRNWKEIMKGGPPGARLGEKGSAITSDDCGEIGRWVDEELRNRKIWVVLMPGYCAGEPLVMGLESTRNWQLLYLDRYQRLYADTSTTRGSELARGIAGGTTKYPDECSRSLTLAHRAIKGDDDTAPRKALDYARHAFSLQPSEIAMALIISAARYPDLRPDVERLCSGYFNEFWKDWPALSRKSGYLHHLQAALKAGSYLRQLSMEKQDSEGMAYYRRKCSDLEHEIHLARERSAW